MERGRFLLVFEQMKDNHPVFRLHKEHKKKYFESGLYIEIVPVIEYEASHVRELNEKMWARSSQLSSEIKMNSPDRPCYQYRMISADADNSELELATLVLCEEGVL